MNKLIMLSFTIFLSLGANAESQPKEVSQYLNMQQALAMDKEITPNELKAFSERIKGLKSKKLSRSTDVLISAKGIEEQRKAFATVSDAMLEHAKNKKYKNLFEASCPMAMKGKGTVWLQASQEVQNPYYGSKMLKCGSTKQLL